MSLRRSKHGMQTRLIHSANAANDTSAISPPIFQTSTFVLRSLEEAADQATQIEPTTYYTRYGSPNTQQAEVLLAELEGSEAALVVGSGMAAVATALLANLQAGDHVIAQQMHYPASISLLTQRLPRYGIEVTQVDQRDTAAFERAIRHNTKIVYTESPSNPTMDLTDLRATAEIAHAAGALAITDNTFASSYNQLPLELGYDLVVQSATKYLNGHADVTAGAIMGPQELIDSARLHARVHGPMLHPFEAWLLRRGLQTYGLRMAVHNSNALAVAQFLEKHPAVERVYYPGLPSHPQNELARRQMIGGFGGMLSFEVRGGYAAASKFVRQTKLCLLAVSLGGVETLMTLPASTINAHQTEEELKAVGISPGLIRFSVGIENVEDLLEDLDQALR